MRYTLDRDNEVDGTFNVLDNGTPTYAYASASVTFSDECEVRGGMFYGGTFKGGTFVDGTFYGGWFKGGWFDGGVFKGGTFESGRFEGGIYDGVSIDETLTGRCHGASKAAGWWDGVDITAPYVVATKLCLVHSEISEAMEGDRKGLMDDHLPHRTMLEVELVDALIRIYDLAGALGLDIDSTIEEKLAYNKDRLDHKQTNRAKTGGKKY